MLSVSGLVKTLGPWGAYRIAGKITRSYPRILMYHRFSQQEVKGRICVRTLENQFRYLQQHFQVVSLDEIVRSKISPSSTERYNKPVVAITIDDGYRDFYEICFPLLQKYGFPATFYVTTDFINQGFWLWHDKLKWIVDHAESISDSFSLCGKEYTPTYWMSNRESLWSDLVSVLLKTPGRQLEDILNEIALLGGVSPPKAPTGEYSAVGWKELREMQDFGISIGGHTKSHFSLGQLSNREVTEQILECRDCLVRELGEAPRHFCFPNGQPADITEFAKAEIANAGFTSGVSAFYDKAGVSDRFAMCRHGVGENWFEFLKTVWGIDRLGAQLLDRNSKFDWGYA